MFSITNQLINNSVKSPGYRLIVKRLKSKHQKYSACKKAIDHFDDFYKAVYQKKWPSVRLALLVQPKKVAVINNFGDVDETEKLLSNEGAFNLRSFLEVQKRIDIPTEDKSDDVILEKELDEVISEQQKQKEEKEVYNGEEISGSQPEDSSDESDDTDKFSTSLSSNLADAKIDYNRLILPDSKASETLLYEFVPTTQLMGTEGYIPESEYFKYYEAKCKKPVNIEKEYEFDFPSDLKVFTFDRGEVSDFPVPQSCLNNVQNFVALDGGELLAALALGVKPEDHVLDMCSYSGNVAYCIFQTLLPRLLVCKDNENVVNLFKNSLNDFTPTWNDMLLLTNRNMTVEEDSNLFDKILVDVHSNDDRNSLIQDDNENIFHLSLLKRRLKLPEVQCSLLLKALKLVRPGGTVLYTTSTLSPIQNDGVVNETLRLLEEETDQTFTVKDLTPALSHTSFFFNFGNYLGLKFGTLIVPFAPSNFGPRYFCKIVKNEN